MCVCARVLCFVCLRVREHMCGCSRVRVRKREYAHVGGWVVHLKAKQALDLASPTQRAPARVPSCPQPRHPQVKDLA